MNTHPDHFIPLHGPLMSPANPKVALICIGIALALGTFVMAFF